MAPLEINFGSGENRNRLSRKRKLKAPSVVTKIRKSSSSHVALPVVMLNGTAASASSSAPFKRPVVVGLPRVASLCNLGNTCFLNSVLYTLRFTPGFLHSLHHTVHDLGLRGSKKRGVAPENSETELAYEVIERLHDLFKTLSNADEGPESREPIPPTCFLQSIGRLNPVFEGNQQQDAHELLVTILNMLQEIKVPTTSETSLNGMDVIDDSKSSSTSSLLSKKSQKKSQKGPAAKTNNAASSPSPPPLKDPDNTRIPNFIKENFVGKSVMSTRCLECEMSTHRHEPFANIDIALNFDDDDDDLCGKELFLKKIMASETLRENNKYWCEECSRLNEAQRSVRFELLPKIMVLQLKRFTGSKSYMSKINDHIPTPFTMNCFCTKCRESEEEEEEEEGTPRHHYRLYAVIMHLGATLASGHYIAYVRVADQSPEYAECRRDVVDPKGTASNAVERKNIRNNKKGIMKYFSRWSNSDKYPTNHSIAQGNGLENGTTTTTTTNTVPPSCPGLPCCGLKSLYLDHKDLASSTESVNGETFNAEDYWLECDDENIAVISGKQFEEILGSKHGATTPYLLFYQKF